MELPALYKPGECNFQSLVGTDENGVQVCQYSRQPITEFLAQGYQVMSQDEAYEMVKAAQEARYCTGFHEISEERWYDALEVLPPKRWEMGGTIEYFAMMEFTCGTFRDFYFKHRAEKTRYFVACLNDHLKHREILEEFTNAMKAKNFQPL